MTTILVLTGVDVEARGLARHLGLERVGAGDWPHFRGGRLEIACVGVGAGYLTERLARCVAPSLVVSAGACGALAPTLSAGELVVPEIVADVDGARVTTDAVVTLARAGTLLSVRHIVDSASAKARLWMQTGALAVDMESMTIVGWARERGLRVAVVRGVSDTASEAVPADLAAAVEPGGRVRTASALRAALARPRAITDALALGRGTAAALKTVAAALAGIARA